MNETLLCTIEQIQQFLIGSAQIEFSTSGDDNERYAHISRVLKHFDYPGRNKHECGTLLRHLQHTCGHSRAQQMGTPIIVLGWRFASYGFSRKLIQWGANLFHNFAFLRLPIQHHIAPHRASRAKHRVRGASAVVAITR